MILGIKPSLDREDDDIGEIEIEVISGGNASTTTKVSFTIQRTYGIRGEISQDCDGTPLGHMEVALCAPGQDRPVLEFRARITNSDAELGPAHGGLGRIQQAFRRIWIEIRSMEIGSIE